MTAHSRPRAVVSRRGADRWAQGHPWIFASDVSHAPPDPGVLSVQDARGMFLGQALHSPRSQIRLRLLERTDRQIDAAWWEERLGRAAALRRGINATAYRLVHGEGDALPSLIVDRYDRWLVVQLLSAGLETMRAAILDALVKVVRPEGILLRNDASVRRHEALPETVELVYGAVPTEVEVKESDVRYFAAPWTGYPTSRVVQLYEGRAAIPNEGEDADYRARCLSNIGAERVFAEVSRILG